MTMKKNIQENIVELERDFGDNATLKGLVVTNEGDLIIIAARHESKVIGVSYDPFGVRLEEGRFVYSSEREFIPKVGSSRYDSFNRSLLEAGL